MGSGAGICAVLLWHSKRSPGNTLPPPRNLTLQFSNLVTAQKLRTNTLLTMYGYNVDKKANEISLNGNFSCFSSQ